VLQAANAYFESLSMLSATEGWIIAYLAKSATGQPNPILLHLHNGFWSAVTMPFAGPDAILAMSPDDAWVASSTEPAGATGLFFHYDQGKWTSVLLPPGMNILYLHRNGPDDAWATGVVTSSSTTGYGQSPALLHFNGTSWSSDSLDGLQNPAQELQMLSANEGWAVGTVNEVPPTGPAVPLSRVTFLQHYVAGTWHLVAPPNAPLALITSFSCASPDDCWALGASAIVVPDPVPGQPGSSYIVFYPNSLLHYYHGRWTIY
jgi:hypothetical protein